MSHSKELLARYLVEGPRLGKRDMFAQSFLITTYLEWGNPFWTTRSVSSEAGGPLLVCLALERLKGKLDYYYGTLSQRHLTPHDSYRRCGLYGYAKEKNHGNQE